jgi:hypothetical protein
VRSLSIARPALIDDRSSYPLTHRYRDNLLAFLAASLPGGRLEFLDGLAKLLLELTVRLAPLPRLERRQRPAIANLDQRLEGGAT